MAKTKKPAANSNGLSKGGAKGGGDGGGGGSGGVGSFGLVPVLSVAVACFAAGYGYCSR